MRKISLIGISALCIFFLISYFVSTMSIAQAKISDHYNGKKFINPTLNEPFSPSFSDIFKMMGEGRPKWPEKVENLGKSSLNISLKKAEFAITFINHATFLIQTPDLNIITDPVWSLRVSPIGWVGPKRVRKPPIEIDSLPHIDVILISHNHYDHLDKKTLKILNNRFRPKVLVPVGDCKLMESFGIENVSEMDWWEDIFIDRSTKITFTPQQHSSGRGLFDRDKSLWGSFFIQYMHRSIYFGGDGGYSTHFEDIRSRLGPPEVAILGIGAYLPSFFMKPIHTSPSEALKAHLDLGAAQSIGMHYGTFQLASEEFNQPIEFFAGISNRFEEIRLFA